VKSEYGMRNAEKAEAGKLRRQVKEGKKMRR
jgi:hypothetical protein